MVSAYNKQKDEKDTARYEWVLIVAKLFSIPVKDFDTKKSARYSRVLVVLLMKETQCPWNKNAFWWDAYRLRQWPFHGGRGGLPRHPREDIPPYHNPLYTIHYAIPRPIACWDAHPPVNRMTHDCENITFSATRSVINS